MKLLADTHAHIYGIYDITLYVRSAVSAFIKIAGNQKATGVLFLTQGIKSSPDINEIFEVLNNSEYRVSCQNGIISIEINDNFSLFIVSGCQFISSEGIEVLGLTYQGVRLDQLPVDEILNKIRLSGAVPVLPWSPGKWLGKRKKVILSLISRDQELLAGDIPIRSVYQPDIFNAVIAKNMKIICGSDTLPMKGEEHRAACYISEYDTEDGFNITAESLCALLLNKYPSVAGRRDSVFIAVYRWLSFFIKSKIA